MATHAKLLTIGICIAAGLAYLQSGAAGGLQAQTLMPVSYTNQIDKNWREEKSAAADSVIYQDLRGGLVPGATVSGVNLDMRYSARVLIGAYVHTRDGEQVARIDDIMLDKFGNAQRIILVGDESFDFGKNPVILNYGDVIDVNATLNTLSVIKPVSLDQLKSAAIHDGKPGYEQTAISVLDGGDVRDTAGNPVARVDNIVSGGKVEAYYALSYGQGQAAGQALMAYKDLEKIFPGQGAYLQMTQEQTDFFRKNLLKSYSAPQNITGLPQAEGF